MNKIFILVLITLSTHYQAVSQNYSGAKTEINGANMYVAPGAQMSIWGDVNNHDSITISSTASITFYGNEWTNQQNAQVVGEGALSFTGPRPSPYTSQYEQVINGTSGTDAFSNIRIDNDSNVRLDGNASITDTLKFSIGKIILDGNDLLIANSHINAIQNYNENSYIVNGGSSSGGYLIRNGVSNTAIDFPVGVSTDAYTPARLSNAGTADNIKVRVFDNTYEDGNAGVIVNSSTVAQTWDIQEEVAGGSDLTISLQHNIATHGDQFDIDNHYITQYMGSSPNTAGDTLSNSNWDLLYASNMETGSALGTITTGSNINDASVTSRAGISTLSYFTKTIYDSNPVFSCGGFTLDTSTGLTTEGSNTWSASWGDYDNDGYDDLFVPVNDINKPNLLYHNNGNGTFTKITAGEIVTDLGTSIAATWGDYDNDGFIDLFVCNNISSENKLYHNEGNGTFTSVTGSPIVDKGFYTHGAAWADYNMDGNLDIVLSDMHPTNFNFLFLGDGAGGFTEDTDSDVGFSASTSFGVAWGDYDNDGDPDLFMANTGGANNQLFRNEAGKLVEVTSGIVVTDGGSSLGGAWGDYDNDGDLDLFVTNEAQSSVNFFYTNDGSGNFTKITSGALVSDASASHGATWVDYDNDGFLDLMVSNDNYAPNLYRNKQDGTFEKISNLITDNYTLAFGNSWSDFDNDGDMDLFVSNRSTNTNQVFQNTASECGTYITVKLAGCNSNTTGIGAKIEVTSTSGGQTTVQTRYVESQGSAMAGQNSSKITFGLNNAASVDSVVVTWTSGMVTTLTSPNMNTVNTIGENCGSKVCGIIYHDANSNGTQDAGENGIANQSVTVSPGNNQAYTDEDGSFSLYLKDGTFTLSLDSDPAWNQLSPVNYGDYTIAVQNSVQQEYCGKNFGVDPICLYADLSVDMGTTAMRRGLTNDLNVQISNIGAFATTGTSTLNIEMDDDIYLIDSTYTNVSVANNKRTYTFSIPILPALSDTILHFTDSIAQSATLGDTVSIRSKMVYSGSECQTINNEITMSDEVVGSIDPNDKHVFVTQNTERNKSKMPGIETSELLLNYKIRFQNIGTYYARRVEILDTLSDKLDWRTFRNGNSSHPFNVSIKDGVVRWVNENIELPDSATNEEESNGYVTFTISPKVGANPYTEVENTAHIQFDRNDYIVTNNTTAVVGISLEFPETTLVTFPNPTPDNVIVLLVDPDQRPIMIKNIELRDMTGSLISRTEPTAFKSQISMAALRTGTYLVYVTDIENNQYHQKVIKY